MREEELSKIMEERTQRGRKKKDPAVKAAPNRNPHRYEEPVRTCKVVLNPHRQAVAPRRKLRFRDDEKSTRP